MIQVGDRVPSVTVRRMGANGIETLDMTAYLTGRRVLLFGVPGAFTPSCSEQHLPGYVARADDFRAKDVDEVACLAVNDAFVLGEWARMQGAEGKVTLLSDGNAAFAEATGLAFDGSALGLGTRLQRFAMLVEDGVVKALRGEDAPAAVTVSGAESMLAEVA